MPTWAKPLLIGFGGALLAVLLSGLAWTAYVDHVVLWQVVAALNANAAKTQQAPAQK